MLLFNRDSSQSLDQGKQVVIMVITANTVFPSGLSQVGANRAGEGGGGNQNEPFRVQTHAKSFCTLTHTNRANPEP